MNQQAPAARLRASQLAGSAFASWFGQLGEWLKAILLPLALLYLVYFGIWHLLVTQSLEELAQRGQADSLRETASLVVNMIVLTLFAVTWHRRILMGETVRLIPAVGAAHVRYLLWLLILGLLVFLFSSAIAALAAKSMASGSMPLQAGIIAVLGFSIILFFLARVSPLFAALAMGQRASLLEAWRKTSGQGFALFFGYLLVLLPVFFLSAFLLQIVFSSVQDAQIEPGQVISEQEFHQLILGSFWLTQTVTTVIGFVAATLGVGVASAAYRELN